MIDPLSQFNDWLSQAEKTELNDPNAMALATVSASGMPSVRMVLLKSCDSRGFVFYTNIHSRKGRELRDNPHAALCIYWKSLKRQVRIEGRVEPVSMEEADAYFGSRARGSQIGAWASQQSEILSDRNELVSRLHEFESIFEGRAVDRPDHWSGYRLTPHTIEFWEEQPYRLHDRTLYENMDGQWTSRKLYP